MDKKTMRILSESGSKGGKNAAKKMTAAQRRARALKAVQAREQKRQAKGQTTDRL